MEPNVFIAACKDYDADGVAQAVGRILDWRGGAAAILDGRKTVFIKANLLMARQPEAATTAHPAVVQAVAAAFVQAGGRVVIGDSPGGAYNAKTMDTVYRVCGMEAAARAAGAELNRDYSAQTVRCGGHSFEITTPALQADVLINIGKVKTHMLTYYTGAVKNLFGTVAGMQKKALHARYPDAESFSRMLVALCLRRVPELSILDGVEGMEGKGPSGGSVRHAGMLLASPNPWAVDLAAMDRVGLDPRRAPVHRIGARLGQVPARAEGLAVFGDAEVRAEPPFLPPWDDGGRLVRLGGALGRAAAFARTLRRPYPVFGGRCVGCGDCAAVCPKKAIVIADGRAVLDRRLCIKCYCCHELCGIRAVEVDG